MNPIYNECINFLEDMGLPKGILQEGVYWLDNQIIKYFDRRGNPHNFCRVKVNEDLSLSFKLYSDKYYYRKISWEELVAINNSHLTDIENHSLKLIDLVISQHIDRDVSILISGGKDSSVTQHLVSKCCSEFSLVFNNTTLDCADTYKYIKSLDNVLILTPSEGFYTWQQRVNLIPTRFTRACCGIFKEGCMVDVLPKDSKYIFFMGMRNLESNTRSSYGDYWKNLKWGNREWDACLPIRTWSELDVWLYIFKNNIEVNPKYKKGYSRVGCAVACPYYSKFTWCLDRYWYPKLYERWHNILEKDFISNRKAILLNCTLEEYHSCWNGGMLRDTPTEEVVKEFSDMYDLDISIAKKFFNKECKNCGKKLKNNDVGLSLKYFGRNIEQFMCIKCLAKELNVPEPVLKSKIDEFKDEGCKLF